MDPKVHWCVSMTRRISRTLADLVTAAAWELRLLGVVPSVGSVDALQAASRVSSELRDMIVGGVDFPPPAEPGFALQLRMVLNEMIQMTGSCMGLLLEEDEDMDRIEVQKRGAAMVATLRRLLSEYEKVQVKKNSILFLQ
jgi:hypothetical protein